MAPGIMRGRSPRARPLVLIIRYRRVLSHASTENSRFSSREKRKKKDNERTNEKKNPRAGGLFAYSREMFQFQQRRAYIDRQDNPPFISLSFPPPSASVSICAWIFHDRAGIYFWNEESFVDALSTRIFDLGGGESEWTYLIARNYTVYAESSFHINRISVRLKSSIP